VSRIDRFDRPARGWQFLAWAMVVVVGLVNLPTVATAGVSDRIFYIIPTWTALGGLLAYAYGLRARPLWFWRGFAPLFSLLTMAQLGAGLGRVLARIGNGTEPDNASVFAFALSAPLIFLTCIGLLRHARLLRARERSARRELEGVFA
jgi:hypothetical protein